MERSELVSEYNKRKKEIKNRLKEFKENKDYFYELCFCLLTPQSKARNADKCVNILKKKDFLNNEFDCSEILRGNVRFHNNKAKYLIEAKNNFKMISKKINEIKCSQELREYLVKNIKGFFYKESSHFIRNIGYRNLAILDRHILKNLVKLKVIEEVPKNLSKKKYLEIEEKFFEFSKTVKIPMDELDLLFWSIETGEVFK